MLHVMDEVLIFCFQIYGIGLKELWQVAPEKHIPGLIEHTVGWPLPVGQINEEMSLDFMRLLRTPKHMEDLLCTTWPRTT